MTNPDGWHVPGAQREAYIGGTLPDVAAWSLEAHLMSCARCRAELGEALTGPGTEGGTVADLVREVYGRLDHLPPRSRVPRTSPARRVWLVAGLRRPLGASFLIGVVLALAAAVVLDRLTAGPLPDAPGRSLDVWFSGDGSWLIMIAPLLPLLGVAVAYGPGLDPGYELVASTPSGGFRLVLWRTAGVLVVALPTAAAVQWITGAGPLLAWLVPGLALTLATLALGTSTGLTRAGGVVGLGWAAGTVGPALLGSAPVLLTAIPVAGWLFPAVACAVVILARQECFSRLGPAGAGPVLGRSA